MLVLLCCLIGQFQVSAGDAAPSFMVSAGVLPAPIPIPKIESQTPAIRKKVRFYTASWCKYRKPAEDAIAKIPHDFDLEKIDVDRSGWPAGVNTIPYFEWDSPDGTLYSKWTNASDLIGKVRTSKKVVSRSVSVVANPLAGNFQHYGVRGMTMEYHVRHDHGVNTSGMSAAEIQQAHNAVHAGIPASRINEYMRSRSR